MGNSLNNEAVTTMTPRVDDVPAARADRLARIESHARSRAHLPALTIFGFS
jgi:hypothetical protein